jgi:hypothetical protein
MTLTFASRLTDKLYNPIQPAVQGLSFVLLIVRIDNYSHLLLSAYCSISDLL